MNCYEHTFIIKSYLSEEQFKNVKDKYNGKKNNRLEDITDLEEDTDEFQDVKGIEDEMTINEEEIIPIINDENN